MIAVLATLAVSAPPVLSLDDALARFRARGYDLLVAQAGVQGAEGDLRAAEALPNPNVSVGMAHTLDYHPDPAQCPGCSPNQTSLSVGDNALILDLLIGKRRLRGDVARAALAAARSSRDDAQRTLEFQVKQQYFLAVQAKAQLALASENLASNTRTRELNERRYRAGAISEADLARVQVAELESQQAFAQAGQQLAQARVALAFLLGEPGANPDFEVRDDALDFRVPAALAQDLTVERLVDEAARARPDLRALEAQVERTAAAARLARRQRIPDIGLSFTYSQEGSGTNALQPPTLGLSASTTLPLFYFQGGEVQRAEADLRTQAALRDKARAQVASDVQAALAGLAAAREQVERMQGPLLERATRARDLVQIQYEKGAASLLELFDARRTWLATRTEYLQDLANYWIAVAQLEQATAKELRR